MKKRSQKSVLWLKIQLRCLKQHLYWLPIKYRVDYQILLLDNYESQLDVGGEQPVDKLSQLWMFDSLTLTRNIDVWNGVVCANTETCNFTSRFSATANVSFGLLFFFICWIFSSLNKCTLSISVWFLVEWVFFFIWDFPSVDSECSNMFL